MDEKLIHDIERFFFVYENRTSPLLNKLPKPLAKEFTDELELLRESILNRLAEHSGR